MMRIGESPWAYRRSKTLRCSFRNGTICGHTLESPAGFPTGAEGVRTKVPISQAKGQSIKNMIFLYFMNPFIYFRLQSFGFVSRLFISDFKGGFLWILWHC